MKVLFKTYCISATIAAASLANTFAGEESLIEPLRSSARQATSEFAQIPAERVALLKKAAAFIQERNAQGKSSELTFICTHNSRRSHLAQIWAQTAAVYYGLTNVKMFSKVYSTAGNPQQDFAALFSCDQADASCPTVKGAALRLPVLFVDPKVSDNTPAETATYDERSRQIAREMFYMMWQVRR